MEMSEVFKKKCQYLWGMAAVATAVCGMGCTQIKGIFEPAPMLTDLQATDFTRHLPLVEQKVDGMTLTQGYELLGLIKDEKQLCDWELRQSRLDRDYKNVRICKKREPIVSDVLISAEVVVKAMEEKSEATEEFWKCILIENLQKWYDFELKNRPDWQDEGPAPMIVHRANAPIHVVPEQALVRA